MRARVSSWRFMQRSRYGHELTCQRLEPPGLRSTAVRRVCRRCWKEPLGAGGCGNVRPAAHKELWQRPQLRRT